ncbi:MAG: major facilitator superfamily domain-containing protein 6 [Litorilinea sp.]
MPSVSPSFGAAGDPKRGLAAARLFYFAFFGAIGCLVPYLNVYFAQQGLTGTQIGWLGSVAPLIALVANPFWGAVADRRHIHRQILALCAIASGFVSLFFLNVTSFVPLLFLVTLLSFFRTPIAAILDSSVLDMVRKTGGHYGRQRMWGSVGFVLATVGLGQWLNLQDFSLMFWIHAILLGVVCFGLSFAMPVGAREGAVSLRDGMARLLQHRAYVMFLGSMALLGISTSCYVNFLGLHLLELGAGERLIGIAWAANGLAEIPIMYLGGRWFARFRYGRLILLGYAGYTVVWLIMASAASPTQVVLGSILTGVCYGTVWVAAVNYAGLAAPPGLSATAQALVGAVQSGIGWSIGAVLAGYLWDGFGGQAVFIAAALATSLAVVLFWFGDRTLESPPAAPVAA